MSPASRVKVNLSMGRRDEGKHGHGNDRHAEHRRRGGHAKHEHGHPELECDEHIHGRGSSASGSTGVSAGTRALAPQVQVGMRLYLVYASFSICIYNISIFIYNCGKL